MMASMLVWAECDLGCGPKVAIPKAGTASQYPLNAHQRDLPRGLARIRPHASWMYSEPTPCIGASSLGRVIERKPPSLHDVECQLHDLEAKS
jgi:hypothetical protein